MRDKNDLSLLGEFPTTGKLINIMIGWLNAVKEGRDKDFDSIDFTHSSYIADDRKESILEIVDSFTEEKIEIIITGERLIRD